MLVVGYFVACGLVLTRWYTGPGDPPGYDGYQGPDRKAWYETYGRSRAGAVDALMLLKLSIMGGLLFWLDSKHVVSIAWFGGWDTAFRVFCGLNIFNLTAAVLYYSLFRNKSHKEKGVLSRTRLVLLAFMNFFELVLTFALYFRVSGGIAGASLPSGLPDSLTAIYYSTITSLTVGYGDLAPVTHNGKTVTVVQGMLSILIITVLIGRVLGSMPAIEEMDRS